MAQRMTCPRGHHWDAPLQREGAPDVFGAACPVCGAAPGSAAPGSVTPSPTGHAADSSAGPGAGPVPPLAGGSGRVFWIATLLVAFAGIVCLVVLPFVFPDFDWFGASSLKDEKTVSLRPGETVRLQWDSPLVQKATVSVKSPGNPVNVYVVLQSDVATAIQQMERGMPPPTALASKPWVENTTVEVAPGKKPFVLLLQTSARKADVSVTVRGR